MVCQGHHSSVHDPGSEVDQSAMELVGYHTSQREMRDVYQSIYLLRRTPGLPPCCTQSRRRAIQDILSSLEEWLHRHGHSTSNRNLGPQERQAGLNQRGSCEEALRAACQLALDTAEALRSNIKRLRQRRGRLQSHSRNCSQSRSHSRDCSQSRSQSRGHSRAPGATSPTRWSAKGASHIPWEAPARKESHLQEPGGRNELQRRHWELLYRTPVSDVETWLEWQANQMGTSAWWMELQAILGIRDPWKLAWKIRASFYIPKVRMRTLLEPGYTVPPAPRSLDRNTFLPDNLSYQDVQQKPALLTVTYTRSLSIVQRNKVHQGTGGSFPWPKVLLSCRRW